MPVGTQVVARVATKLAESGMRPAGAVGAVVEAPADATRAYRVRFADGGEGSLRRGEIAILKQFQQGPLCRRSRAGGRR